MDQSQNSPQRHDIFVLLHQVFGYTSFRDGQEEIIRCLLRGNDCLALMPTGAGKSLCYQIPALIFDGPSIVVSPLVALMQDQVAALQANGVAAETINSSKTRDANVAAWRRLQQGQIKLLYISPERLMTATMLKALQKFPIAMIIIDEAHCIAQWGHDFRPEYRDLGKLQQIFPTAVIGGFTATADAMTRQEICDQLYQHPPTIFTHGFDRPNIYLQIQHKTNAKRQLVAFLDQHQDQNGIIYCLSRKTVMRIADFLTELGYQAYPYHAGLDADIRRHNQERFLAEKNAIIVATIAFGMGIDKPDVRFVFHLDLPASMEAYYQEIGRAGRDGKPATASLLYGFSDIQNRRGMILKNTTYAEKKRLDYQRLEALLAMCEASGCRRQILLRYFGEHSEKCGHCDNCLAPPQQFEATELAKKLIAIIEETGQIFGQNHIIDILMGAKTARIGEKGHQHLLHYGAGKNIGRVAIKSYLRQLYAANFIDIEFENYGALVVTAKGAAVGNGAGPVYLKKPLVQDAKPSRTLPKKGAEPALEETWDDQTQALYAQLKKLRLDLAKQQNVPAYIVFPDAVLKQMAIIRPMSLEALTEINGIGVKKREKYGLIFLRLLQDF